MEELLVSESDPELERLTSLVVAQEKANAHEDELFRIIFEDSPTGIALVARDGTFTRVNKNFSVISGWPLDELVGMRFQDITHPDDVTEGAALAELVATGTISSYAMEKRYLAKDGSTRWLVLSVSGVFHSGEFVTYISHIQDTTKLRELLAQVVAQAEVRGESE